MKPGELKERRVALCLTQATLARSLGVSRNTIARWERGELAIEHPELVGLSLDALDRRTAKGNTPARPPHNLPADLSSFIGREQDCAELLRLLATTRMLTLIGPGGIGKTRLALRLASRIADIYRDGAWLVELGEVRDEALVPDSLASVLGIAGSATATTLETLCTVLRDRKLLLLLDNCEHLIHKSADLSHELLRASPGLRILATSREPLRVPGELTWRVPAMTLPPPRVAAAEVVESSEAVRLFIDRAWAASPDASMSERDLPVVAEICGRLDGIPLAIELAATRVSTMSVDLVAASLDDRFRLLSLGSRTAPARQRTLRATVEWSYMLLLPPERLLLNSLSAFAGGWSLDAARAICPAGGLPTEAVADLHDRLLEKSLIARAPSDAAPRYRLLETIRVFAHEQLAASGHAPAVQAKHAAYFFEFAEAAGIAAARGPERIPWLVAIEREYDNVREALRWTLTTNAPEDTRLRWAAALGPFWHLRGHIPEGHDWQARLGVVPGRARPTLAWARALTQTGILHAARGAAETGLACFEAAVPIARELGDDETLIRLLNNAAGILRGRGDDVRAAAALEEALTASRRSGDRMREVLTLGSLAELAYARGQLDAAEDQALAGLNLAVDLQDAVLQAETQRALGDIALSRDNHLQAQRRYAASLEQARRAGSRISIITALVGLGHAAFAGRERTRAWAPFREALASAAELGLESEIASALVGLAALASENSQPLAAVRLEAAALRLYRGVGMAHPAPLSPRVARGLASARRALGPQIAAEASSRGQTESVEETIAFALALEPARGDLRSAGPLTGRELEVAGLIAVGLSNREIAGRLAISYRTAATHVEHILAKLSLHSRLEIALWMSAAHERSATHSGGISAA